MFEYRVKQVTKILEQREILERLVILEQREILEQLVQHRQETPETFFSSYLEESVTRKAFSITPRV